MKINVLTLDKQIITLDVDPNHLVGDIKASLNVEQELLYDGKEMKNDEKLSEVGVQEGDLIVVVSDSAPISSSSTTELGLNPDGSSMNLAAFQHKILHNSNLVAHLIQSYPEFAQAIAENDHNRLQALLRQHHQQIEQICQRDGELGITNFEDAPRNVEGEACLAALPETEASSHLLDEERFSKQEPVDSNDEVNEEVEIQVNGGSTHAEKNDHTPHDHHILNSSNKESSIASIQKLGSIDHNDSNFFASHEHVDDMSANNSKGTEAVNSELLPFSPNSPQTTKGHGLKKWRRIRREFTKESTSNVDSTKVLKRGSSNILEVKKSNDGSVSSTCAFVNSPGHVDLFSNPTPSSSYPVALGTTFSAGADDSDDRSSKSSTAASAPKYKHDHQREKHRLKNVSGRHLNSSGQRSQLAKGNSQVDTSKKPRGERINVEKENSLSSMESDSRSYSSVFRRGSSSVNSDQVQSGNYNEEDDNDHLASEVQAYKKLLAAAAGHRKNGNVSPDRSVELSCSATMCQSKDQQVSRDCEPLINSIMLLQSAQEALEREVQLFKEIGKGVHSLCDDSSTATGVDHRYSSNEEFDYVQTLENQLEEAQVRLKEKDLKVIELKKMVKTMIMKSSPQADERGPIEFQRNLWQEMEAELENVFKLKVEAEVQHVVMTGSRKDLGVLIEDQIKFLRDQNFVASRKLIADVRNEGSILKSQSKLVNLDTDMTEDEKLQDMRSRIGKYSSYLVIQLVFFVIVVGVFLLRALPKSATVVPT
ncbi:WPP domain-interacting protein 1-like isoform X2 [Silene latifolia]|uniref:WPP domain-interacting protein 1-like isoform X2 n=1 Tax=Silene latifolia TaxID=37657 RepID=UPI003D7884D0